MDRVWASLPAATAAAPILGLFDIFVMADAQQRFQDNFASDNIIF
jgi:hypothetical protein